MQIDPGVIGCFSQDGAAKMRQIFTIACDGLPSGVLTNDVKCKLASIIIHICRSEKLDGCFSQSSNEELAAEALQALLEMPRQGSNPKLNGFIN